MPFWMLRLHAHLSDLPTNRVYVVRASSATNARAFASMKAGVEGSQAWIDQCHSSCEELDPNGPEGVVLRSTGNR